MIQHKSILSLFITLQLFILSKSIEIKTSRKEATIKATPDQERIWKWDNNDWSELGIDDSIGMVIGDYIEMMKNEHHIEKSELYKIYYHHPEGTKVKFLGNSGNRWNILWSDEANQNKPPDHKRWTYQILDDLNDRRTFFTYFDKIITDADGNKKGKISFIPPEYKPEFDESNIRFWVKMTKPNVGHKIAMYNFHKAIFWYEDIPKKQEIAYGPIKAAPKPQEIKQYQLNLAEEGMYMEAKAQSRPDGKHGTYTEVVIHVAGKPKLVSIAFKCEGTPWNKNAVQIATEWAKKINSNIRHIQNQHDAKKYPLPGNWHEDWIPLPNKAVSVQYDDVYDERGTFYLINKKGNDYDFDNGYDNGSAIWLFNNSIIMIFISSTICVICFCCAIVIGFIFATKFIGKNVSRNHGNYGNVENESIYIN